MIYKVAPKLKSFRMKLEQALKD